MGLNGHNSVGVMTTQMTVPLLRLPVPEIREEVVFRHAHKQRHKHEDYRLRPPKLKPRHFYHDPNFNRSHSSASGSTTAHAISFRDVDGTDNAEPDMHSLSASYDCSADETYFEQCFTRLGKIGEGSFGEVFKVRSKEDGYLYAVKMSKQLFRSEHYRQERLEEVRRYEQFSGHVNFVQFYRAWEQDDRLYMQMELCRESLDRYLVRKRHIPEEKIWSILLDLLLALKNLHDRNLIHLDIKLDNVLIGDDDSCKLADFGLVIDVDRANRHQATEGDSRYMAPEIMQGKFSKAADIFSLGISMLELSCCLELPSNGTLWQQLRSAVLPHDFIKTISLELQTIITQMMAPDPQARPTVDVLLSHKKFVSMLERRNRWKLIKKMINFQKQTLKRTRRVAWTKLCNFKNIVFSFLTSMLTTLMFRDSIADVANSSTQLPNGNTPAGVKSKRPLVCTRLVASTPTTMEANARNIPLDFKLGDNCMDLSQQSTLNHFGMGNKIVNSTPLNHNNHSFRSRKDLTKTSFKAVENVEIENVSNIETVVSTIGKSHNFLSLEDVEQNSHSFTRKPLHSSSLRKKLFAQNEDSD